MPHTVVVCDSQPLYLKALVALVEDASELELAGVASGGAECRALLRECRPDVCLLDILISEPSGIELMTGSLESGVPARFLALSSSADRSLVYESLAAGAAGYLLKTANHVEIETALRRVAAGQTVLSQDLSEGLVQQIRERRPTVPLTERERDVLHHLCQGDSAAEIARRLFLGPPTVRTHLSRIYEKLGVSGRAAAVAFALRSGLVE